MQSRITKTGDRYGRLTVVAPASKRGSLLAWQCLCLCGNEKITTGSNLRLGRAISCGCWQKDRPNRLSHGQTKSPEYAAWVNMRLRCYNPNRKDYRRYGGRGITVCQEWRDSFEPFYEYIGNRPTKKHSVERVKNNGNYEPGNVIWATKREQANNKRNNRHVQFSNQTYTVAQLARHLQVPYWAFFRRLQRGQSPEIAALKLKQVALRK